MSPWCHSSQNCQRLYNEAHDGAGQDLVGVHEDWIPKVSSNGDVSYIAEKGDTVDTFAKQFGLSNEQATNLVGNDPVEAGVTTVSGEAAKAETGSEVLKLDLGAGKNTATGQRKFDQYLFASDHSRFNNKDNFTADQYFTNYGYGFSGKANLDYGTGSAQIYYNIPVLREATLDGTGLDPVQLGVDPHTPKDTTGTMFSPTTIIQIPTYHPNGNNAGQLYNLYINRKHTNGVISRLSRF